MKAKKTTKAKILAICLLLAMVIAATPRLVHAQVDTTTTTGTFSVPLLPNLTPRTPTNYPFGSGTWSGSVDAVNMRMQYTVTLSGGSPNTAYIVRVSFFDATGNAFTRSYGLMTTDASGNAVDTENSQIFAGTVRIALGLFDKTNFSPPLQVLISDPILGGDVPL